MCKKELGKYENIRRQAVYTWHVVVSFIACSSIGLFVGLALLGKDIVFRFIIECIVA
jgi:hypothetical protein